MGLMKGLQRAANAGSHAGGERTIGTKRLWDAAVLRAARRMSLAAGMAAGSVIVWGIASPAAYGQASSSSDAVGKVTDASGATVPGATVHLVNNATGAERTAITNDSGEWSIPNIPPASYKLRIEKQGFKTVQIPALDVEIGKAANGSVTLQVGGSEETIEVSTLPPQLQTQEATVGQVIDQKQINDLPLNGRNVLQLATLAPGVSPAQTGNTGAPAQIGTRQLYITVDGGRGSSTNYVLDGTYVRSVRFNNMSIQPNTDTIQEFNLLRSTFSTEYGQGQAVVSMVTKSGSNAWHGSAYEFARNSVFDARNYFATSTSNPVKPNFSRHQFGGTLGFPIKKDKLFIFGGYEGLRSSRDTPTYALFPTQAQLAGNFVSVNALPGPSGGYNYSATNPTGFTVTSKGATALNPTYPVVGSDATSILGSYNYALTKPFTDNYDQYTIRADQTLSARNTLYERYVNFDSMQGSPQVTGTINTNPLLGRNAVIGHTFLVTSKIVNEVRVGWNEFYNIGLAQLAFPSTNWASVEGLTNVTALNSPRQNGRAGFTIQGYTSVGDGAGDQGGHENVISAGDSISDVLGKHTLKAGFQYQNRRLWQIADNNARGGATFDNCTAATRTAGYAPTGPDDPNNIVSLGNCPIGQKSYTAGGNVYLYNKFQNYARGMCTSGCNGNFGSSLGHYRDNTYGAFGNDVWQLGHGLTVNLGLRWEYNSPWVEQNGLEGTLDPSTGLITFSKIPTAIPAAYHPYLDLSRTYRPGIVQPQKQGFMPRLGIAYEVHSGTVVRAGFGIYLDNLNTNELQFTRTAAPLYFQQAFSNVFTNSLYPDPLTNTQIPSPFSISPTNGRPYTQEWNLSLQQDLGHGTILELAYTGSNSHKLWKRYDQNQNAQQPGDTVSGARPFPQFGIGVLTSVTRGDSNFNGGSAKIEKRAKNGLFVLGSYQWAKNLDNSSGEAGSNDSSYAQNFAFDHSYSNFDVRNRATISGGYELPFGKGHNMLQSGVGNALAGGWTFQPAIQLRTGYPFSPSRSGCTFGQYIGCRVSLATGRTLQSAFKRSPSPFSWFDPSAFTAGTASVQGNVTRNTLRGPGTAAVDLSAIKNFRVFERFNFQFRAEAYNILNRAISSNPAANISTPSTVGKVTSTSIDNRSIQLAVKVTF